MQPQYTRLPTGTIEWRRPVGGDNTVVFRARDVRRTKTGVHAKLLIGLNTTKLALDNFNIEREPMRTHLAGSAISQVPELKDWYLRKDLEHDLMLFCDGLWQFHVDDSAPAPIEGAEELTGPDYLVSPYVLSDAGTILFAPPGSGKSYLAMLLAVSVDSGSSTIWKTRQAPVLYVNLERGAKAMKQRLALCNLALDLPQSRPLMMLNRRGSSLADVVDAIRGMKAADRPELVFLDSLSRAGFGDLNENAPANEGMDALNSLDCAWVCIAHTPRSDDSHVYGSQMFDAAADLCVRVRVARRPGSSSIGLSIEGTKANDVPLPPKRIQAMDFGPYGLTGIRDSDIAEFPGLAEEGEGAPRSLDDQITNTLQAHGAMTQQEMAESFRRAPATVSAALNRLFKEGRVRVVEERGRSKYWGVASGRD